jgi:N-acetylglutamate synthase
MDDSLRRVVTAYADTFELMATKTGGRTQRGPDGLVLVVTGGPHPAQNAIISPSLDPDAEAIASLAESVSWDFPWSIHVRGTPGPAVTEVAARYGLTEFTQEPLMVRHTDQGPPDEPPIDSLRIRPIAADELGLFARALEAGLEIPSGSFEVLNVPGLAETDGITFYLAELDGVPVATGMTAVFGDVTGLSNISTLPRYRRRGYGRAMTLAMVRAGFAVGAATAYLCATEMGEPVYKTAGFRIEEYLTVITAPS